MIVKDGVLVEVKNDDIVNGTFNIPEGVTEIGEHAFQECESLTNIKIPKGVTKIGAKAFLRCVSLIEIEIPEGVTEIGKFAFGGCERLTNIKIPKGITKIKDGTFIECTSLIEIEIPEGVTEIGNDAFYLCSNLTNIEIPKGVTKIGENAFIACVHLANVKIPEGVTEIGNGAFTDCISLNNIELPESIVKIGNAAFLGCSNLKNVQIPKGVTQIGNDTFYLCSNLTNIEIPKGVKKIGQRAFAECNGLTSIEISNNVEEIGEEAFAGNNNLETIKIPDNASIKLRTSIYEAIVPSDVDETFYLSKQYNLAQKILFKDDYRDIQRIKNKANFKLTSRDYDENQMNIFYSKMINAIGIEEIERIVELPNLTEEEIKQYTLEKDEAFKELYDTKFKISGDLGVTLKLLKQLQQIKSVNGKEEKNSIEKRIFRGINEKLEEGYKGTLTQLVSIILKEQDIEISEEMLNKIQDGERNINKKLIKENLSEVETQMEEGLSSQIVPMQIKPIKIMINNAIEDMFRENGKIELDILQESLEERLQNAEAPYIRQNSQQIVDSVLKLAQNKEFLETINHSSLVALKNTKEQIGGAWKYKLNQVLGRIGYTFDDLPENLSKEEIENLNKILEERTEKTIKVETSSISVPKEGIERKKAYKLLASKNLPEIVTYQQIHDMFGPVHEPYSENFKTFFKKHRKEFLENPQYYEKFGSIHNNFETIINSPELKNIYQKGELTLDGIIGYMSSKQYENQRPEDEELAKLSKSVGNIVTEDEFAHVQKVFDVTKKRERTTIPPMSITTQKYRGRMLEPDDVLNLFAGNITTCCQRFGDIGEGAMLLGAIEENGGIFVIEELDEKGQTKNIVGQSLTIRQKGKDGAYDRLTFDNIEINNDTLKGLSDEEQAQILEIYKEAGKRAIEKDKKFLGKLLKKQKITQEQYDSLVLKEVVAGTGYNDLKGLKELSQAQIAVPDEAYYVYNGMGNLKRNAWIDSTGGHAPLGSNGTPVVIAVMDENELKQIQDRKLKTKKEVKPTEIPLWYGKVGKAQKLTRDQITEEKVEIIKQIEEITYREEQQLMNKNNVKTVDDIEYGYNIDNMNLEIGSNNDWYLIYGEYDDLLVISDLAVIGGINAEKNSTKNENIKSNPKLAIAESSNEVYDLLIHASEEDKRIVCNATANTSLVNITRMLKKGLASVKTLNGEKIEYREEGLVYSDSGKKVETRSWDDNGDIQMLDLEIIPNVPELEKEKKKVEEFLRRTQENIRMHGEEKEAGLDELRKQIREEKKASDAR